MTLTLSVLSDLESVVTVSHVFSRMRGTLAATVSVVLAVGLVGAIPLSASASPLPAPTVVGMTGARPSATRLSFPISDQVSMAVDVGTGNLEVATQAMTLPGVTSAVPLTAVFNSMSQVIGAPSRPAANKWIASAAGAGTLTLNSTSGDLVFVSADGATWSFAPVAGSAVAFTSPAGFQATVAAQLTGGTVSGYTLTSSVSQTVEAFDSNGLGKTITDRNGNVTTFGFDPYGNPTITSSAGPTSARTATIVYNAATFTETVTQRR